MSLFGYRKVRHSLLAFLIIAAMILLDRLTSMQKDMPIILTGDFNTVPNSELYKLLKTKSVKAGIGDIHKKKYSHLRHKLWIDSAYYQAEQSEPECTIKVGGVPLFKSETLIYF